MVNVFVSDESPQRSAQNIDNKRLSRMCYEAYEVLSSALLHHEKVKELKPFRKKVYHASKGHFNHPVVKWIIQDQLHFEWVLLHAEALNEEYQVRYKKLEPCAPHAKMNGILRKALKYIPSGKYDHNDFRKIDFEGFFNFNQFKFQYSKTHPGDVQLDSSVSVKTRYRLYMMHKWLYLDVRDSVWPSHAPVWAYNPLYRQWLKKHFGKVVNKPAMLNPKGSGYVLATANSARPYLSLRKLARSINRTVNRSILSIHYDEQTKVESCAVFDKTEAYRLYLSRQWSNAIPLIVVMLNPSTADAFKNDPTVALVEKLAKKLDCGGYIVLNVAAFRATEPKDMLAADDPFHEYNSRVIKTACSQVVNRWRQKPNILLAYGNNVAKIEGGNKVAMEINNTCDKYGTLVILEMTKKGYPRHPLYYDSSKELERYLPW